VASDDEPTRETAVKRLVKMLKGLIAKAEDEGFKLAPFVGVACPGVIDSNGSIKKGAQNLPGNWESSKFNLPASLIPGSAGTKPSSSCTMMAWCKVYPRCPSCRT
jgi:hypothetical protein